MTLSGNQASSLLTYTLLSETCLVRYADGGNWSILFNTDSNNLESSNCIWRNLILKKKNQSKRQRIRNEQARKVISIQRVHQTWAHVVRPTTFHFNYFLFRALLIPVVIFYYSKFVF